MSVTNDLVVPTITNKYSFEQLIAPLSLEEFVANYWEQKDFVLKRQDSDFYSDLLSMDIIDEILDRHRKNGDNFRVANQQELVEPARYLNADGSYNLNKLYSLYADGFSIVLRRLDQHWLPIKKLCYALRQTVSHHVKANMYLTPPESTAYRPHTDAHDVVILQISGTKHWKLYDPFYETPLVDSPQPAITRDHLSNMREITMEAGDFMYIPRGVPHEASTGDESSLHLTIGIFPVQVMDLLIKSLHIKAYQNRDLRKALPFGFLNDKSQLDNLMQAPLVNAPLSKVAGTADLQQITMTLEEELRHQQPPTPDGHFHSLDQLSAITLDTPLCKRDNIQCTVQKVGPFCRIVYNGNTIKGPTRVASVFEFVQDVEGVFTAGELPIDNDKHRLTLAKRMVRGGLLRVVQY